MSPFYVWLFSLRTMFSRHIHIFHCINIQCFHSLGFLYFCFFIINTTDFMYKFLCGHKFSFLLVLYIGVDLLD